MNERLRSLPPYPMVRLEVWRSELADRGIRVFDFGTGDPREPTPELLRQAMIEGIDAANDVPGVTVFHAGTALRDGAVVTNGGRVLTVTAIGADLDEAAERAYRGADAISFEGKMMRRDIGWRARRS